MTDLLARLDERVHHLYRVADSETADGADADFVALHTLMVDLDGECNALLQRLDACYPQGSVGTVRS